MFIPGSFEESSPNLDPIVATSILNMLTIADVTISAMSAPGILLFILGQTSIIARASSPTIVVLKSMLEKAPI